MTMLADWFVKHFCYDSFKSGTNLRTKSSVCEEVCFICSYRIQADLYQLRFLVLLAGTILIR